MKSIALLLIAFLCVSCAAPVSWGRLRVAQVVRHVNAGMDLVITGPPNWKGLASNEADESIWLAFVEPKSGRTLMDLKKALPTGFNESHGFPTCRAAVSPDGRYVLVIVGFKRSLALDLFLVEGGQVRRTDFEMPDVQEIFSRCKPPENENWRFVPDTPAGILGDDDFGPVAWGAGDVLKMDFYGSYDPGDRDKSAGFHCEYRLSGAHAKLTKLGLDIDGRDRLVRPQDIVMISQWDSPRHQ